MTSHRFATLDGVRGMAALVVLYGHITQQSGFAVLPHFTAAVDIFFCLSGVVLAQAYRDRLRTSRDVRDFLLRRLVRLYPMFLIGFALGIAALLVKIAAGQSDMSYGDLLAASALNSVYLPYLGDRVIAIGPATLPGAVFPGNAPAWSLAFELAVNLVFAVWAVRARAASAMPVVVLGAVLSLGYTLLTHQTGAGWNLSNLAGGLPRALFGFFAGVWVHANLDRLRRCVPAVPPGVILGAVVLAAAIPYAPHEGTLWFGITLLAVPAIVALGTISPPRSRLSRKIFDYVGWLSYPVYCVHFPIYLLFTAVAGKAGLSAGAMLACAAAAIVSAHLVAVYVDAPLRARMVGDLPAGFRSASS